MKTFMILTAGVLALGFSTASLAQSDEDIIKNAEAAAPAAVASGASILAPQADGTMKTLREGTNGFWCMPDNPGSPSNDPMCGDANSMDWAKAWMGKTEPPKGKVGLIYMLAGGSDSSNTDPFATAPTADNDWITTGPHIMIMNAVDLMAGYPSDPKPDTKGPFVMWSGTPYQHLMVPVE